jgi:hypothetical protein
MVMVLFACPIPIFAPAEMDALLLVPFSVNPPPPPPPAPPIIVILGLVLSWLNVMFDPARNPNALELAVFTEPRDAPPAAVEILTKVLAVFDIVIVEAFCDRDTPAPASRDTLLDDPFKLKLVAAGTLADIVIFGLVLNWDRVMLLPATRAKAEDEAVFAVPLVAPPAALVIEVSTDNAST